MIIEERERSVFHRLWASGPVNRLELAREIGLTPNAAGNLVNAMIRRGLLRDGTPAQKGRGRPTIPVEIDATRRQVLGLSLSQGRVQTASLNLRGQVLEPPEVKGALEPKTLIRTAQRMLAKALGAEHLAVGLSVTGFADPQHRRLLLSSALAGLPEGDLSPLFAAAGKTPVLLQNDMHALAARWLLTQPADPHEDLLLVLLADGQVGATMLIGGTPNAGCVLGGSELGHMRFPVATDRCYCGQTGCLERIFCSEFGRARLGFVGELSANLEAYEGRKGPVAELIALVAAGLANVSNFVRPHRLVIVSPYTRHAVFANDLLKRTRELLLGVLAERVRIDLWEQPAASPAETAGFLPLAAMCLDGWAQ